MKKFLIVVIVLLALAGFAPRATTTWVPLFSEFSISQGGDALPLPVHSGSILTWTGDYYHRPGDTTIEVRFLVANTGRNSAWVRVYVDDRGGSNFLVPVGFDGEGVSTFDVSGLSTGHHEIELWQGELEGGTDSPDVKAVSVWIGR